MAMTAINFNTSNYLKVARGYKRTTIRMGDKPHTIGLCVLMCDGQPTPDIAEITEVRKVRFGSLGLSDAIEHGYKSVRELQDELEICYLRSIQATDVITIVRLELDGD